MSFGDTLQIGQWRLVCQSYSQDVNANYDTDYALLDVFRQRLQKDHAAHARTPLLHRLADHLDDGRHALHPRARPIRRLRRPQPRDRPPHHQGLPQPARQLDLDRRRLRIVLRHTSSPSPVRVTLPTSKKPLSSRPTSGVPGCVISTERSERRDPRIFNSHQAAPMPKRLLQSLLICFLAAAMLGADNSTTRLDHISPQARLPMRLRPDPRRMQSRRLPRLAGHALRAPHPPRLPASTEKPILDFFIGKYGPIALAAPIRGGFDNVAWIVPIAATLLCGVGVLWLMRRWKSRATLAPTSSLPGPPADDSDLHARIRRETEHQDWSDPQ